MHRGRVQRSRHITPDRLSRGDRLQQRTIRRHPGQRGRRDVADPQLGRDRDAGLHHLLAVVVA